MAITLPIVSKFDDRGLSAAERALKAFGVTAGVALAAAAAGAVAFGVASVKAAAEAEAITRGLANAAKNANTFGDSALAIDKATRAMNDHSRALGEMSGIDDEIINQIKTGWLAVPDLAALGTKGINHLADVTADIAAGTGKDVQTIGLAFQRIAGDTDSAFTKLTRAGIVFTDSQKATYDNILTTSGAVDAQAYLVEELGKKYAGAAEAGANPFERLQVIFGNLQEDIGAKLLPALDPLIVAFQNMAGSLTTSPEFNAFLSELADTFIEMMPSVQDIVLNLLDLGTRILPELNPLMNALADATDLVASAFGYMNDETPTSISNLGVVSGIISLIVDLFKGVDEWLKTTQKDWGVWGSVVSGIIGGVAKALNGPFETLKLIYAYLLYIIGRGTEAARVLGLTVNTYSPAAQREHRGLPVVPGTAKGGVTVSSGLQWVGEKGPELLSMPKGATVTPIPQHMRADQMFGVNRGSGGGGSIAITVNAGMGANGAQIGEEIVKQIRRYERTSGQVFASA